MNNYYIFEYLYRDSDNFKAFGQLLLSGEITDKHILELKSYLDCEEYFVAEQVNIPTLYSELWKYSNGQTLSDHAFHEFSLLRAATIFEIASLKPWGAMSGLLEAFRIANRQSWDCSLSLHCQAFQKQPRIS